MVDLGQKAERLVQLFHFMDYFEIFWCKCIKKSSDKHKVQDDSIIQNILMVNPYFAIERSAFQLHSS